MLSRKPSESLFSVGLAVGAALVCAVGIIAVFSSDPAGALRSFFLGPFANRYAAGNMLNTAGLFIVTGLAAAAAFQTGLFNLGGEGQVYAGAAACTLFLLRFDGLPGPAGIILALLCAAICSAFIAGISGVLKRCFDTDELISSFLFSGALIPVIDYLISGPFRYGAGNLLSTAKIKPAFHLAELLPPSHMNSSFIIALLLLFVFSLLFRRTLPGYEMKIIGLNREFARYGGINVGLYTVTVMMLSGALHGLSGSLFVLGTHHAAISGFTAGMGWNGLAVALIAKTKPVFILPAAFLIAYLEAGARAALLGSDFSLQINMIIQSIIFFFITVTAFKKFSFLRPGKGEHRAL